MLSTLIYRSRMRDSLDINNIHELVERSRLRNEALRVTGILLFDGTHFVQILEGPDAAVDHLFDSIKADPRHFNIVSLLRDHASSHRFSGSGMELFNLQDYPQGQVLGALSRKVMPTIRGTYEDRVLRILRPYAESGWIDHFVEGSDASEWNFPPEESPAASPRSAAVAGQPCQYALQPIVEPLNRRISSFEALVRTASGGPPDEYFSSFSKDQLYKADLRDKVFAFRLARQLGLEDYTVSINLFPMSLVAVPDAADVLVDQIRACGLAPEKIIVEVTEQEAISNQGVFAAAIIKLRRAGIGVAIDDFGAGFAGLSLLAEFQPDKLKIDRAIIQNIHTDGPRQAIVRSMLQACSAMGITPVAEGVETVEEWCWLQAAGVERFQGFLFAKPALNSLPRVRWPEPAK